MISLRPLTLALLLTLPATAAPAGKLRYNRDIRPILSDNCFHCHGPDKNHREADMRLDIREDAVSAKAIVPGKPEASGIIQRLMTHDEDEVMPPPESKKTLTEAQKKTVTEWIAQGAEYEPHWAYTPLVRPTVPKSPTANPIDTFIHTELAEKNISPSPQADERTIIRRMSLDLTGLPPTPAEVKKFVEECRNPSTFFIQISSLADRLMQSPHFGERWAAWWLDVARFSDTVGFHGDQNQRIFPFRDYVINAFNANKRFDQFTLEQLAGDLLPNATTEQLIASGFNRLNMMTREGGAQAKEYLAKYQADRVRTVGGAWLGATLGCCKCHDHKFDPYKASDFYSMSAYFGDVKQYGVYSSYRSGESEALKGWTNDHPFPPEILVDSPYLKQRLAKIEAQMEATATKAAEANKESFAAWRAEIHTFLTTNPSGWITPQAVIQTALAPPTDKKGKPNTTNPKKPTPADDSKAELQPDGSVLITAKAAQTTTLTFEPGAMTLAAVKIELLPTTEHKNSLELNGTANGMTLAPQFFTSPAGAKKDTKHNIRYAEADHFEPRYSGTAEVIGVQGSWKTKGADAKQPHTSVWLLESPMKLATHDKFTLKLPLHSTGSLRVSLSAIAPLKPLAAKTPEADAQHWLTSAVDANKAARDAFAQLHREALECRDGKAWTQITVAVKEPLTIRRLPRGNWMDESGEICPPSPPTFISGELTANAPRQTRADLAKWITSKDNPLTARAFVNRLWKQFFGTGLSAITDDLGAQGETPSHPELLDWLACEFRDSGWDIQHMMKLIVTSQTYLQDSKTRPELKDADPANRMLAFQNARRLDAEFVRDNALFAAGILNLDLGGPSAKPYQPPGYYDNLQFPNRDYIAHTDDRQWRRGVYMHWQRTFLHPMLANFDAPARDECTCSRNVSNTPQQALTLLNDPTFVEAARSFAESLPAGSDESRIKAIYLRALARLPKDAERASLLTFLESQRAVFKATPEDATKLLATGLKPVPAASAPELAAWTSVCRVVLNLHETITRY